ncbi:MAG: diaminobutyrate acetyltransferase [Anaerolineaceae bacterium]|nr:diaminobutyrate acetyltransferase [Anaerolineaceae bacterium]
MNPNSSLHEVLIRHPGDEDAGAIWRLVENSGSLDHNSFYCYFVLCHFFYATCAVAELEGVVVGFVSGFRQPEQPDTLFVWQVRVQEKVRGLGLARRLIEFVLHDPPDRQIRFVEATISPDNQASQALFRSLASTYKTEMLEIAGFLPAAVFPAAAGQHEQENLFRVGPLRI